MRRVTAIFAMLLALSLFAPALSAQEATPAAGECIAPEIAPGTPTPMEAVPAAEPPAGEPASDDVAAEVEAAVQNFANCFGEGDYVVVAALYTPEGLQWDCGTTNIDDGPMCFGGSAPITNVVVSDVRIHDDSRISADVTYRTGYVPGHERFYYVVDEEGMYWLDITPNLPLEIPESATVIEGELVDYEFALQQTSAPAGDLAFDVTNTGAYPHEIVMFRLPEGLTVEEVMGDESLMGQVEFFGAAFAEPGQKAMMVTLDIEPGTYTLLCFVDVPGGVPHIERGMILEFEVTAP